MVKLKKTFILLVCVSLGLSLVYALFFSSSNINISMRLMKIPVIKTVNNENAGISGISLLPNSGENIRQTEPSRGRKEPQYVLPVNLDHMTTQKENGSSSGQQEKNINASSEVIRGPGDSNLPFEEEKTAELNKFPTDLFKEKAIGVDPPDPYNPPLKKILFWNDAYSDKHFGMGFGREPFIRAGCRVNTCMTTGDRKRFPSDEIDAVIWHFRAKDLSLPTKRSPHTRYVFWMMESATHLYGDIRKFNNIFNWTFTYRLDSDIPNPYNIVYRRQNPLPVQDMTNITSMKTKFAAWFVSNCNTAGGRKTFVKTLKQWINVDIYGVCGPLKCERKYQWDNCYKMLERDYKFYFSFENSLCKDYATEKFFNILKLNVVPVVYGFGSYNLQAPAHSFIDALAFPSAKALADYLLYLNKNDTAYNEYFKWKRYHRVGENYERVSRPWCALCERLHTDQKEKTYDLHKWFVEDSHCESRYSPDIQKFITGVVPDTKPQNSTHS